MALIGGGGSGFIGKVHRTAAQLDGRAELVAGAFSSSLDRSRETALAFGVDPARAYASWEEMLVTEAALPENERVDFVSIATPNYLHFPMAQAALVAGFNVICDKPMTTSIADAETLVRLVEETNAVFALTHNYTGYPMVRQAKEMIAAGELGEIRAVRVNYVQGWMWAVDPDKPASRGVWKDDPLKNGPGATIGDVGTHAYNLARYMSGLTPVEVLGKLMTYSGRQLDDYGHSLVRCSNDALIMVTVSQVTHGRLNDLSIEIDGEQASLSWRQEEPNSLTLRQTGQPQRIYDRAPGQAHMNDSGNAACRIPGGHPEAFFEAFANVYSSAYDDMIWRISGGGTREIQSTVYPNVYDGLEGVRFVEQTVASSKAGSSWLPLSSSAD